MPLTIPTNPSERTTSEYFRPSDLTGSYFGSLGRPHFGGSRNSSSHHLQHHHAEFHLPNQRATLTLSESEPEVWPLPPNEPEVGGHRNDSNSGLTGLHPPPVKTARLSTDAVLKQRTPHTARRYGSIRVAECSFIEAESQASTPSASICEIDSELPSATPTALAGNYRSRMPTAVAASSASAYHHRQQHQRHQQQYSPPPPTVYDAGSLQRSKSAKTSLPPPPTTPKARLRGHETSVNVMCNGPLALAQSDFAAGRSASVTSSNCRDPSLPAAATGPNGQQSHIIPPPQNFSSNGADYTPLTTTRIGSRPAHADGPKNSALWPRGYSGRQNEARTDSF